MCVCTYPILPLVYKPRIKHKAKNTFKNTVEVFTGY